MSESAPLITTVLRRDWQLTPPSKAKLRNAKIESTRLFSSYSSIHLTLDYGAGMQGFTGICTTERPLSAAHSRYFQRTPTVLGTIFISGILAVAGKAHWEELCGSVIRAYGTEAGVYAIGHYLEDMWFCPEIACAVSKKTPIPVGREDDWEAVQAQGDWWEYAWPQPYFGEPWPPKGAAGAQ